MLIDDAMPEYQFREYHQVTIDRPAEAVRAASREWRPSESLLWRLLLVLRGLGAPRGNLRDWAATNGFLRLAETADEVVYGQIGRFWAANERGALVSPRSLEEFLGFRDQGYAAAVMDVRTEALSAGRTRLSTETRVRCLGRQARRWFRLYWLAVRPFSGLLRRAMLRGIKARARRRPGAAHSALERSPR